MTDTSAGVLPGVTVTITNIDTGLNDRSPRTPTDSTGRCSFRSGATAWSPSSRASRSSSQSGIALQAGQTDVINVTLEVGAVSETMTVTAESPIAQPGKIDLGRTLNEVEIHNLPLPSRNPYNFAFLQANVTGYENTEFGVPRINANGSQMHTNYQLDGNTNTEKDRAGLRLLPISEVLVREVKIVTNGFAPEFGQTTGMVYNAITPVGHQRPSRLGQLSLQEELHVDAGVLPRANRDQARHRGRRCDGDAGRTDRQESRAFLRRVRIH